MGKGGVSGVIGFPEYIEDVHQDWMQGGGFTPLGFSVVDVMAQTMDEPTLFNQNSGTPIFDDFDPTTPAVVLSAIDTRHSTLDAIVGSLSPKGDWCDYIKEAAAKVDSCISRDVDSTKIIDESLADAVELVKKFFSDLQSDHGIIVADNYSDYANNAVTKADLADVLKLISFTAPLTDSRAGADSEVTAAIAAAQSAAVGTIITNMKDAYETRQESTVANQVRRFMGSMTDSNSIHGSSFVMGLALIYSDHQRDVADVHTALTKEAFTQGINLHKDAYLAQLDLEIKAEMQEKESRDRFVLRSIDTMTRILQVLTGYEEQILQIFAATFARQAEVHLRSLMGNKASRDSFVGHGVDTMTQMLARKIQAEEMSTRILEEIGKFRVVSTREFEAWEFDVSKRRATWNLDVYTMGGAMLGAPAGMTAVLPKEPSAAASVVSGALGGAAIGSMIPIPGVSTAIGAGIGAIIGGLGGAL